MLAERRTYTRKKKIFRIFLRVASEARIKLEAADASQLTSGHHHRCWLGPRLYGARWRITLMLRYLDTIL